MVRLRFPSDTNATLFWLEMANRGLGHLVALEPGGCATVDLGAVRGDPLERKVEDLILLSGGKPID